jgi:hypothetical protein
MATYKSRITGQIYLLPEQAGTWHDNRLLKRAVKLSTMFKFELLNDETEFNLKCSVEALRYMYEDLLMTNSQFVEMFNWHSKFFTGFLEQLGIKRRTRSESLKNYARIQGREITDIKKIYWNDCQFKFNVYDLPQIYGFDLLHKHKWYNYKTNPNGITRDHMYSIMDGWINNVDPQIICHPANCQILLARDNFSKNNSSSITLEQLQHRISGWNQAVPQPAPNHVKNRVRRSPLSDVTKNKIREHNLGKRIYTNGVENILVPKHKQPPQGYILGSTRNKSRAIKRPSQWDCVDWNAVQSDLESRFTVKQICQKYAVTKDALHWARKTGLIQKWYKSASIEHKHDWGKIQSALDNKSSLKTIISTFQISRDQLVYARNKGLLSW